ncbi:trypsin-like serine protease [Kitasatospora sp. NPDC088264]|uniref:trypsin-like serine protease n=1 Tax=Kitasatospora sp. NPDC088264 TaxID=3155296 RepID=UPI003448DAF6
MAVESFSYPDAEKILADRKITLKAGDGHIQLADCASGPGLFQLLSRATTPSQVCFTITGPTGYLAMEIPKVYDIRGDAHTVKATLNTAGRITTFDVPKNKWTGLGEGASADATTLLELNATDGPGVPTSTGEYPAVGTVTVGQPGRSVDSRSCTATLVDRYWLLTSTGCFASDPAAVVAGAPPVPSSATIGGKSVAIAQLVSRGDRDLAMARLATPVTDIKPAALATTAPVTGEGLRVLGYGRTATDWVPSKVHATTHAIGTVTATSVDTAPTDGGAAICPGDAGAPLLRATNGVPEVVGVASRSWQGGCLGTPSTETRIGASSSRVDDLGPWVQQAISAWGTAVDYSSAVVNSVYNPDSKTAEIFALGTDGVLAHASNTEGKGWNSGWEALGDWQFTGIPATIYNPATKATELFAIRKTGELGHNYWDPATKKWAGWSVVPSALKLKANPVAVFNPSNQTAEVFTLDTNGYMTHTYSTNGARWDDVRGLGTWQFTGTPTTLYNPATDAVELFATSNRNELGHNYWDNKTKTWGDWSTIGGQAVTGSPTAVVNPANNSAEVFITTTNNAMAHSYSLNGARWSDITTMGGWQFNGTPTAVYNPAAGAVELFAVRDTGELGHNYWDNKTKTWADWSTISDWKFSGTPSATYNAYTNALELFATGTNGTMSRATYQNNQWLAWESMPGWTFAITG